MPSFQLEGVRISDMKDINLHATFKTGVYDSETRTVEARSVESNPKPLVAGTSYQARSFLAANSVKIVTGTLIYQDLRGGVYVFGGDLKAAN